MILLYYNIATYTCTYTHLKLPEGYNGCSGNRLPQSKGVISRVFPISQQGECVESIQHAGDDILLILSRRSQARELNERLNGRWYSIILNGWYVNLVSFPDPITHARKGSGDIGGLFSVLRTITWLHVLQYKPMQIITWLLSLQNQESAPMSPDLFLLLGVGSGDKTNANLEISNRLTLETLTSILLAWLSSVCAAARSWRLASLFMF